MGRGGRTSAPGAVLSALPLGLLLLTACSAPSSPAAPAPPAYDGPLWVAPDPTLDLDDDPGAAGRVVTCDQPVLGWSSTHPLTGGEVGESPEAGLQAWRDDGWWPGFDGEMRAVRSEPDRVLFTYAAGAQVLQAVVVHHGPVAAGTGGGSDGIAWYVESSARCDVVEYPDGLAESRGTEVWTDPSGRRVSSQRAASSTSDGRDCLERGDRTLALSEGDDDHRLYLADSRNHPDAVDEASRADVALPTDAVDTGLAHGPEHLWVSADRRRAYVGTADRVDVWPRLVDGFGCA